MLSLRLKKGILVTKVHSFLQHTELLPYISCFTNPLCKKKLPWYQIRHSVFDSSIENGCRKLFYNRTGCNPRDKYKNDTAPLHVQFSTKKSAQHGDAIEFVKTTDSSNIKFKVVDSYQKGSKHFTKLTAQFRFGKAYGDETFFATYWKPGKGHHILKGSINALIFISHGYGEYLGDPYDEVARLWSSKVGGGCLVFGHDHVGHGRTTAGERVFVNEMKEFIDPIIAHAEEVQKWNNCKEWSLAKLVHTHTHTQQ